MSIPPTVIGGVNCFEMPEGFGEGSGGDGPAANKAYFCDWSNRYALANALLGFSTYSGGVGGPVTPPVHYRYPESSNMIAREVSIEGRGKPIQGPLQIQFDYAVVTVRFGVTSFGTLPSDDPTGAQSIDPSAPFLYATQSIDFHNDAVTWPGGGLTTVRLTPLNQDMQVPVPTADLSITLHKIPYLPSSVVLKALKKPLNVKTFLGGEPRRVKFNGAKSTRTTNSDGSYAQDVHYSFSYRPVAGWDETPDPTGLSATGWVQVITKTGLSILQTSDLSKIFPAGYTY